MQNFSEVRVREVRRYTVTVYKSDGVNASSELAGEFDNIRLANSAAEAIHAHHYPSFLLNKFPVVPDASVEPLASINE